MGRIIQKNNGKTTVFVTGENFNTLLTSANTYYVGVDLSSGYLEKLNPTGNIINLEAGGAIFSGGTVNGATTFTNGLSSNVISATTYQNLPLDIYVTGGTYAAGTAMFTNNSGGTFNVSGFSNGGSGGGIINTSYAQLTSDISGALLSAGTFYVITDYQTVYDQPDFDYDGNPINIGNYKQGPVEPLLVLATSTNTISSEAYQPEYPNDKITYDWSFSATEVTNSVAFGRITERIDEFNNRTDYDHRNILFKRYRLFTHREGLRINGTIELLNDGTVNGTDTIFTGLTTGDVIYIPSTNPSNYVITSITDNLTMLVSGDTINTAGPGAVIYKTIEENNGGGYFSYKQTNVKTDDFIEYTTFGDAISNDYAKNNYIGNYANNYTNIGSGTFILANNVFLEGQYESNKFGDYCYNNTFGTDNQNNVWGDWCYQNVSVNDIDNNIIGHYFNNNLINANLVDNHIGTDFNNNRLLNENGTDFEDNIIGNGFSNNLIYHGFYKNEILDNFNNNVIGDFGNLDNFQFYRNYISNNFNTNTIRQDFQNNQIGTNYQENTINGLSQGNTILNGFNNNQIGSDFNLNNIGNAFNNNTVYDEFYRNTTDYYFNSNIISNQFNTNNIGTFFRDNKPSNNTLFGWDDLSTVSTRTYGTFLNSVSGSIGNLVLGKEFVMRVISTSQYFKIKFTQWTQNANGGGFQYTREELDSGGNSLGPIITFTKVNNGSEVDVIVPGVLEITRGVNNGIYNIVSEGSWNGSVSPADTEWNSIYTEPNNGERFAYNKIGNEFQNNTIGNDFGFGGSQAQGNIINDSFNNNTIGQFMYSNVIGNYFTSNTIGDNFENNTIKNYFLGNDIANDFESNDIGNYFGNLGGVRNIIFNDFKYNKIGNFFGNNTNYPTDDSAPGDNGGNVINDEFKYNIIGDNAIYNAFDSNFRNNRIGDNFWSNTFNDYASDNTFGNYTIGNTGPFGAVGSYFISNKLDNYSVFNNIGDNFQSNKIGEYFGNSSSSNQIDSNFKMNIIDSYFGDDGSHSAGGNTIGAGCDTNNIGPSCTYNVIDDKFNYNNISNGFTSNITSQNFKRNIINTSIGSVDFTVNSPTASVYRNYTCQIFERDGGDKRLSYYDSSDVLTITDINI